MSWFDDLAENFADDFHLTADEPTSASTLRVVVQAV